jgi:hypothetical protein
MKKITTTEFDKKFDAGEDVSEWVDLSKVRRLNAEPKRVNVDFPAWMVGRLDREAERLGLTRQALIKVWVNDRIMQQESREKR